MSATVKSQARRCALQAMYEMDQGASGDSLAGTFADAQRARNSFKTLHAPSIAALDSTPSASIASTKRSRADSSYSYKCR